MTFRLYDWGHVDTKTGQPRPLQVDQAFTCIDFDGGAGGLVASRGEATTPVKREMLFDCEAFRMERVVGNDPFTVGAVAEPRVPVCIEGSGQIKHGKSP